MDDLCGLVEAAIRLESVTRMTPYVDTTLVHELVAQCDAIRHSEHPMATSPAAALLPRLDEVCYDLSLDPFKEFSRSRRGMLEALEARTRRLALVPPEGAEEFLRGVVGIVTKPTRDTLPTAEHCHRIRSWLWWRHVSPASDEKASRFREFGLSSVSILVGRAPEVPDSGVSTLPVHEDWSIEVANLALGTGNLHSMWRSFFLRVVMDDTLILSAKELDGVVTEAPRIWDEMGRSQVYQCSVLCRVRCCWLRCRPQADVNEMVKWAELYDYCMHLLQHVSEEAAFLPWEGVLGDSWFGKCLGWLLAEHNWESHGLQTPEYRASPLTPTPLSGTDAEQYEQLQCRKREAAWANPNITFEQLLAHQFDQAHVIPNIVGGVGTVPRSIRAALSKRKRIALSSMVRAVASEAALADDETTMDEQAFAHLCALKGLPHGDGGRKEWLDHLMTCGLDWGKGGDVVSYMARRHHHIGFDVLRICQSPYDQRFAAVARLRAASLSTLDSTAGVLESTEFHLDNLGASGWCEYRDQCQRWIACSRDHLFTILPEGNSPLRQHRIAGLTIWNRPYLLFELVERLLGKFGRQVPIEWIPDIIQDLDSPLYMNLRAKVQKWAESCPPQGAATDLTLGGGGAI